MTINRVILVGTLAGEPDVTPDHRTVTVETDGESHTVQARGRWASVVAQDGHDGRRVYVEGRLQTRDGSTIVIADTVRFLAQPTAGILA